MEPNVKWHFEIQGKKIVEAIRKNRIQADYVPTGKDLAQKALSMIPAGSKVGMGMSMTLVQTELLDELRKRKDISLIDRHAAGLTPEQSRKLFLEALTCDVYISGVNAITEKGELYFLDANGNRVAPILYGPPKVIIIAGANKVVADLCGAVERMRKFTAPTNAKRISRKTPCQETGYCMDCNSPERICNNTVVVHKQVMSDRMHVIVAGEVLGY